MTRLAAFAVLLALSATAVAQDGPEAPLTISDATVGILRARQTGSLILPEGIPPFPAVVVLHGCNGISPNTRAWARRLASWGYAALILDSFTPRGIKTVCARGMQFPGGRRAKDAFVAAAYLRTRADIDPDRIGVLGYSHGGWTALASAAESIATNNGGKPFAAVVAYYPNCPQVMRPLASDVQILAGGADDWAPAQRCVSLVEKYATVPAHRPLLKIYPDAFHSFDAERPDRLYLGHRLAYDAKAAIDSFDVTKRFLDGHLKH